MKTLSDEKLLALAEAQRYVIRALEHAAKEASKAHPEFNTFKATLYNSIVDRVNRAQNRLGEFTVEGERRGIDIPYRW